MLQSSDLKKDSWMHRPFFHLLCCHWNRDGWPVGPKELLLWSFPLQCKIDYQKKQRILWAHHEVVWAGRKPATGEGSRCVLVTHVYGESCEISMLIYSCWCQCQVSALSNARVPPGLRSDIWPTCEPHMGPIALQRTGPTSPVFKTIMTICINDLTVHC